MLFLKERYGWKKKPVFESAKKQLIYTIDFKYSN